MNSDNNSYTVYVHVNKMNNKKYVGITKKKNPKYRWEKDGKGYRHQAFYLAILKYGWDNFDHIILETGLSFDEACIKEIEYIKKYDSYRNGYNNSYGGDSSEYKIFSNDNCRKIICLNNGEIFERVGIAAERFNTTSKNLTTSINKHKAICYNDGTNQIHYVFDYYYDNNEYSLLDYCFKYGKHSVICIETMKTFWCSRDAEVAMNLHKNSVSRICKHQRTSINGFHFLFLKEYIESGIVNVDYSMQKKKVICLTTNEIFDSEVEAARKYGITSCNILSSCNNINTYAGTLNYVPLYWQFYKDYLIAPRKLGVTKRKMVHCIELDLYFISSNTAGEYLNICPGSIAQCCKGNYKYAGKSKEGQKLHWEYYIPSIDKKIEVVA